jgi:hypothetical protein
VDTLWPFGSGVEAGGKVSTDWFLLSWLLWHFSFFLWVAHKTSVALELLDGHAFETFVGSCSPGGFWVAVDDFFDLLSQAFS